MTKKNTNKVHIIWSIGVSRPCHATKKPCPYGDHASSPEKAQQLIDSVFQAAQHYNTEAKLFKHNEPNEVIFSKNVDKMMSMLRGNVNKLEKQGFQRYYQQLVTDYQKNKKGNTPSKAEALERFRQTSSVQFAIKRLKNFEEEILELIEQRQQATDLHDELYDYIQDYSYSNASCSSYFIFKKEDAQLVQSYLNDRGFSFDTRPLLENTPGKTFMIRLSDHHPKSFLRRRNKEDTIWTHTDASILVQYKDVQIEGIPFTKRLSQFVEDNSY